jgi:polar amino acid transport system substrate-binding protein
MVGFNPRFSSFSKEAKALFTKRANPLIVNYRINAGFIPKSHWSQDIKEGGGRIIGEICHFIDLIQFLVGSPPVKVYAEGISPRTENVLSSDNLVACIKFEDGSIGNITYSALGNKKVSKERIEIFGNNSVFVIDDFRSSEWVGNGTIKKRKKWVGQDKGHKEEVRTFIQALLEGQPLPIDFSETVITTLTTFKVVESIYKDMPVNIYSIP